MRSIVSVTDDDGFLTVQVAEAEGRYAIFSDHHMLFDGCRQNFFRDAGGVGDGNRDLYVEVLRDFYAVEDYTLVENGDVEELIILEPDLSEIDNIKTWSWDEIKDYRESKKIPQLKAVVRDNRDYYTTIQDGFIGPKRYFRITGNHDRDMRLQTFADAVSETAGIDMPLASDVLLLRGGSGVDFVVCHGHQFDTSCTPAFAAELGSMKITEEIDALRTLGISPVEHLVVPRVLGLFVMMPLLTIYAAFVGVFGGVLVALGFLLLMAALGLAVGVSAVEPGETEGATLGTGAGLWAAASLLLALFIGGWVSTRIGAIFDGTTGFFEGALVWVVSILLMLYFAASGIGMLAGGAFQLVGGAAQALGSVVQSSRSTPDVSGSVDQMIQRLRDPNTAAQIANATGMPASEVQATLSETAQRVESNRSNPTRAAAEAKNGVAELMQKARSSGALQQKAQELQPQATRAAWITFGALVLSLAAAVLGATAGRRNPREAPVAGRA